MVWVWFEVAGGGGGRAGEGYDGRCVSFDPICFFFSNEHFLSVDVYFLCGKKTKFFSF